MTALRNATRNTIAAALTAAVLTGTLAAPAQAGYKKRGFGVTISFGHGGHYGHGYRCFFKKKRVLVGYTYYGKPIFRFRKRRVCH